MNVRLGALILATLILLKSFFLQSDVLLSFHLVSLKLGLGGLLHGLHLQLRLLDFNLEFCLVGGLLLCLCSLIPALNESFDLVCKFTHRVGVFFDAHLLILILRKLADGLVDVAGRIHQTNSLFLCCHVVASGKLHNHAR